MNPIPWLTGNEVRSIDRTAIDTLGIPGVVLMENAGRGVAMWLRELDPTGQPVLILAGKGNNGGDGYVIARHLDAMGVPVMVLAFADSDGDAKIMRTIIQRSDIPLEVAPNDWKMIPWLESHLSRNPKGWIVDALLGTGLSGDVRAPLDRVITKVNASGRPILSVDLPSGMDCDTGEPLGPTIRATATATFVAPKRGMTTTVGQLFAATVRVIDIGVPASLLATFVEIRRSELSLE